MSKTVAIVAALAAGASAQTVLVLDGFDTGALVGTGTSMNDDAGGERDLMFMLIADPLGLGLSTAGVAPGAGGGDGAFFFVSGPGGALAMSALTYNNFGVADLTVGGLDGFEFEFASADLDFQIAVTLSDTSGFTVGGLVDVSASPLGNVFGVRYADFTGASGFDFTSVNSIVVGFNVSGARDLDFSLFEFRAAQNAVPNPGVIALAGAAGLLVSRRRGR